MSLPATGQAASQPKVKKLRLSCDGCLGAKVKCTKERPVCGRCANQNISCVYSESRRAGRRGINSERRNGSRSGEIKRNTSGSPLEPGSDSLQVNWDEEIWPLDLQSAENGHLNGHSQPTLHHFDSQSGSVSSLDPVFNSANQNIQNTPMDLQSSLDPAFANLTSPESKPLADWINEIERANYQGSYPMDTMSPCTAANAMLPSEFTPESSAASDSSHCMDSSSMSCNCLRALQDKLSTLEPSSLPFDQFIAVTKSAVAGMIHCLGCNCMPDISSVMLLSLTITRLVQWHKQIGKGNCQASEQIGVVMGNLKVDSEDEYQIKQVLIRSELIKIRSLIDRFRDRFESHLCGNERQVYEASVEFLENELDTTIEDI